MRTGHDDYAGGTDRRYRCQKEDPSGPSSRPGSLLQDTKRVELLRVSVRHTDLTVEVSGAVETVELRNIEWQNSALCGSTFHIVVAPDITAGNRAVGNRDLAGLAKGFEFHMESDSSATFCFLFPESNVRHGVGIILQVHSSVDVFELQFTTIMVADSLLRSARRQSRWGDDRNHGTAGRRIGQTKRHWTLGGFLHSGRSEQR